MRTYNFPVSAKPASGDTLCRVVLNPRFTAKALIDDYPKTITARYLNDVLSANEAAAGYVAADERSIDIVVRPGTNLTDADRAIVLNLLDFGQDFENDRSTTVEEVIFFRSIGGAMPETLLDALALANAEAGTFMTERLAWFPPADEYLEKSWPQDWTESQRYDWPGYFFFNFEIEYADAFTPDTARKIEAVLNALHDINMWNGFNEGMTALRSVQAGRAGLSFDIWVEGSTIGYTVERTPCDPALSLKLLVSIVRDRFGVEPVRWNIAVEPED